MTSHVAVFDGENAGLSEPCVRRPRRGYDGQRPKDPHRADGRHPSGKSTSHLLRKGSSGKTTLLNTDYLMCDILKSVT